MTRACMVGRAAVLPVLGFLGLAGCGGGDGVDTVNPDVGCSGFAAAASSPYVLPWHPGHTYATFAHLVHDRSPQKFAVDVPMPIGTDILAMRAGTVARVEESFFDGDVTPGHENFVFIEHADGTAARYFHLTHDGALVNVGDVVAQGEHIALSGHTGHSSEPHLHFDVTRLCCTEAPNHNILPQGETLPLSFRNASPDSSCGLRYGERYTAQP